MAPVDDLREVLADGVAAREAGGGIWSVLPADVGPHPYDSWAGVYDAVVGSGVYNRLAWRSSPREYTRFAAEALASSDGWFLEAGCGSLVFTAAAYARAGRPLVLMDQSLGMLQRARDRLVRSAGRVPAHVVLLQADLRALPFRPSAFRTILSLNVLHLIGDAGDLLGRLGGCLERGGGRLYATSLVRSGRAVGDRYMRLLHRTGEFAPPRDADALRRLMEETLHAPAEVRVRGSMAYAVCPPPA